MKGRERKLGKGLEKRLKQEKSGRKRHRDEVSSTSFVEFVTLKRKIISTYYFLLTFRTSTALRNSNVHAFSNSFNDMEIFRLVRRSLYIRKREMETTK